MDIDGNYNFLGYLRYLNGCGGSLADNPPPPPPPEAAELYAEWNETLYMYMFVYFNVEGLVILIKKLL